MPRDRASLPRLRRAGRAVAAASAITRLGVFLMGRGALAPAASRSQFVLRVLALVASRGSLTGEVFRLLSGPRSRLVRSASGTSCP